MVKLKFCAGVCIVLLCFFYKQGCLGLNRTRRGLLGEPISYHVSIEYGGYHKCSGALISMIVAITVQNCVRELIVRNMQVRAGTDTKELGGEIRDVRRMEHHPGFTKLYTEFKDIWNQTRHLHYYQNDVSLVIVDDFFGLSEFIAPIKLSTFYVRKAILGRASGWYPGLSKDRAESGKLAEVDIMTFDDKWSEKWFYEHDLRMIKSSSIADLSEFRDELCMPDTGSPLIRMREDGGSVLFAMMSGSGCDYDATVGTRVSEIRTWIRTTVLI